MQEFNPNLLSKEQLCVIIEWKNKKIESLERKNHYQRINHAQYWFIVCLIITVPVGFMCLQPIYSLKQMSANIFLFVIAIMASIYSIYKVKQSGRRAFFNDDSVCKEWIVEKEIFVEDLSTEKLKDELEIAIEEEDYNYATIIRDELKQRA